MRRALKLMYYRLKGYIFSRKSTIISQCSTICDFENKRTIITEQYNGIKKTTYIYDDGRTIVEGEQNV